jgi:proline iminopeptidase
VESEGARIHYRTFGSGDPVVIINGGPGLDSREFASLARLLAPEHLVVIFDQRGTGRSGLEQPSSANVTMDLMLEDLEAIRGDLGVASWSVLGHSFGGMLASHYAAHYGARIDRLVLSSSSGVDRTLFEGDPRVPIHAQLSPQDRGELEVLEARHEAGDATPGLLREFSEILARAYVVDDTLAPQIAARMRRRNDVVAKLVSQDLERVAFDAKPALAGFPGSVLILHGAFDVVPLHISERAREAFQTAHLVILEGCGHYGWIERPQAYAREVLAFLAAGRPRGHGDDLAALR